MSCADCYCGRKEAEASGVPAAKEAGCGPVEFDALLKAYEEGDISREDLIKLAGMEKK